MCKGLGLIIEPAGLGRLLPVVIGVLLMASVAADGALAQGTNVQRPATSMTSATTGDELSRWSGMDPKLLPMATAVADQLSTGIDKTIAAGHSLTEEDLEPVWSFYQYGAVAGENGPVLGTPANPGDARVIRKFCREFVLASIYDWISSPKNQEQENTEEGEEAVAPVMNASSINLVKDMLLTRVIETSPTDLSYVQRIRLYRLAGRVLEPDDTTQINALEALAAGEEIRDPERPLIWFAIEQIHDRAEWDANR